MKSMHDIPVTLWTSHSFVPQENFPVVQIHFLFCLIAPTKYLNIFWRKIYRRSHKNINHKFEDNTGHVTEILHKTRKLYLSILRLISVLCVVLCVSQVRTLDLIEKCIWRARFFFCLIKYREQNTENRDAAKIFKLSRNLVSASFIKCLSFFIYKTS